ncbi:Uncharacterised protein [Vibrio cholerae]|nr:Uncharacterised protein [Vibrio cholerae]
MLWFSTKKVSGELVESQSTSWPIKPNRETSIIAIAVLSNAITINGFSKP